MNETDKQFVGFLCAAYGNQIHTMGLNQIQGLRIAFYSGYLVSKSPKCKIPTSDGVEFYNQVGTPAMREVTELCLANAMISLVNTPLNN